MGRGDRSGHEQSRMKCARIKVDRPPRARYVSPRLVFPLARTNTRGEGAMRIHLGRMVLALSVVLFANQFAPAQFNMAQPPNTAHPGGKLPGNVAIQLVSVSGG